MPYMQRSSRKRHIRGVYALEWAFVFPVFFLLVYAILSFGLTFAIRESMQFALEDGARAALRYPVGISAPDWTHRRQAAVNTVISKLQWLPQNLRPTAASISFSVCAVADSACTAGSTFNPTQHCDTQNPCLVLMSYVIDGYPAKAITPLIFDGLLPQRLSASSSILVDRSLL